MNEPTDFELVEQARLCVGDTLHEIDARPSDAIALALCMNTKIAVTEAILAQAGKAIPEKYQGKMPRKGLAQLAAKMEAAKREFEEMMANLRTDSQAETPFASERLFAYLYGE